MLLFFFRQRERGRQVSFGEWHTTNPGAARRHCDPTKPTETLLALTLASFSSARLALSPYSDYNGNGNGNYNDDNSDANGNFNGAWLAAG